MSNGIFIMFESILYSIPWVKCIFSQLAIEESTKRWKNMVFWSGGKRMREKCWFLLYDYQVHLVKLFALFLFHFCVGISKESKLDEIPMVFLNVNPNLSFKWIFFGQYEILPHMNETECTFDGNNFGWTEK